MREILSFPSTVNEKVFAFCLGCKIFGVLMRVGLVPDDVCAECADIWSRPGMTRAG